VLKVRAHATSRMQIMHAHQGGKLALSPHARQECASRLRGAQVNVTLEELHLDTNQVDNDGATHLAQMLAVNKSLRKVSLAANRIGDEGMAALAEMLKSNSTLLELDLSSNEIGYDGALHACRPCASAQARRVPLMQDLACMQVLSR
jgi:hypothetical protein